MDEFTLYSWRKAIDSLEEELLELERTGQRGAYYFRVVAEHEKACAALSGR